MTTYCKDIANLLFWELWECWTIPIKNHSINLKETFMLTCTQKFKLITLFSLWYCKKIANTIFWVNWACLVTHAQNDGINFKKYLMFICRQKIDFVLQVFLEISQINCKLVIFGTLVMPVYGHPNWCYQPLEIFHVYLQAKNQLHLSHLSKDIAKTCKPLLLGTLGMPGYAHPKW